MGAAAIFTEHGASACTDVTGFGLAGHLLEMIVSGPVELYPGDIPALDGALECLEREVFSSLHADNKLTEKNINGRGTSCATSARYEILFDPQTAGGLLAAVPGKKAKSCLAALHEAGLEQAAVIGLVGDRADGPAKNPIGVGGTTMKRKMIGLLAFALACVISAFAWAQDPAPTTGAAVDTELAARMFRRGNVYSNLERYEEAIEEYRKAVAADPNFIEAIRNLANIYYFLGA